MGLYILKVLVSVAVIVGVTELARRSHWWAAVLVSLPLTSLLAFSWMHVEGASSEQIARMSMSTLWLVLPSLLLFAVLAVLLRQGVNFWISLGIGCLVTAAGYAGMALLLERWNVLR